jgi:lipid II:glycine glycyltransferase (peptidoglycan interpeptide bridge formation enzyme)
MLISSGQVESIFSVWNIQIEKRSIWMKQYWFFILACSLEQIANKKSFKKIKDLAEKENVLFIQIETLDYSEEKNNVYSELFKDNIWYYKKFITPFTAVINLEKTEDEILSEMKPKWRYNIKLAGKKWVEIKSVEKTKENIEEYYKLMLETTSRDNFSWNKLDYYITFLEKIENSELLLAYKDDVVIAGWIFVFDDNISIYYYWASTSKKEYRNLMAPYLLQWEAIKIAKKNNSKIFDFLWVSSPDSENDSLSGVTSFKKKLTPDIRFVSESYIFINKKLKYNLFKIVRKIRKLLK